MAMAGKGSKKGEDRHWRAPFRDKNPDHSTILRVLKQMATPDKQFSFSDFEGDRIPEWERIREKVIPQYSKAVGAMINRVNEYDAFREPVVAALDITTIPFWPFPYKKDEDGNPITDENGDKVIDEEFPDMVSGVEEKTEKARHAFKFATLTIVGRNVPIILAVEPVKDDSDWDDGDTLHRHEIVGRLLDQATEHVDIHLVMADREFDGHQVAQEIDNRGINYLIPKRKYAKDIEAIEDIEEHDLADAGVLRDVNRSPRGSDEEHTASIMFAPSQEHEGNYRIMVTNRDVPAEDMMGVIQRYDRRWEAENEYKQVKEDFLARTSSKDYRVRFLYFSLATMLYNIWRLTDYLLKGGFEGVVSDDYEPFLGAGEIVELIALFLRPFD